MLALFLPRSVGLILLVWGLLVARQQKEIPASPPPTNPPANEQPTKPNESPQANEPAHPATQTPAGQSGKQTPTSPPAPRTLKEAAWQMLESACTGDKTNDRVIAIRVLGLISKDPKALKLTQHALNDEHPAVRSAAAAALGDLKSRASIGGLRRALDDADPTVALAAAHSLVQMHDDSAYEVYYEILNGERKTGKGLLASQKSKLNDPKKLAKLGFEEGIGFIPFAGIGWGAIKAIAKDDSSPIRAAAAKVLARDPDPVTTKALADATFDKSWLVRAAALEALAKRGNPSVLETVKVGLSDDKDVVRYTAAATVLQLTAIKESRPAPGEKAGRSK